MLTRCAFQQGCGGQGGHFSGLLCSRSRRGQSRGFAMTGRDEGSEILSTTPGVILAANTTQGLEGDDEQYDAKAGPREHAARFDLPGFRDEAGRRADRQPQARGRGGSRSDGQAPTVYQFHVMEILQELPPMPPVLIPLDADGVVEVIDIDVVIVEV